MSTLYYPPKSFRLAWSAYYPNIGALIIRIGFWCILYHKYNKEPHQNSIGNYLGPYSKALPEEFPQRGSELRP